MSSAKMPSLAYPLPPPAPPRSLFVWLSCGDLPGVLHSAVWKFEIDLAARLNEALKPFLCSISNLEPNGVFLAVWTRSGQWQCTDRDATLASVRATIPCCMSRDGSVQLRAFPRCQKCHSRWEQVWTVEV